MAAIASQPKSTRRERWAWYLYDFGNSAYAAVVLLAVYVVYFQGTVVGGQRGTKLWGIAVGIAMLVVTILSPILGTLADFSGAKKRFLGFFTAQAVIFCGLLFFVRQGTVVTGMLFFILAEIGYRGAQVFYDALLPEIASADEMGTVSGNGWAIGSFGGIVCLIVVLALIQFTGIEGTIMVQVSLLFTALYFGAATIPLFLWLGERAQPQPLPQKGNYITVAFKRLGETFGQVRRFRELIKFIVAFLIYNDGILMVLEFGGILGSVLYKMGQTELIIFMIVVQVTSIGGAYLFGIITDRVGGKRTLTISLLLMIAGVLWMYFNTSKVGFYLIGALAGFALTGVQSVSRTVIGLFSPPGKSAEFYGFFSVAGRTSSFIGPPIYGLLVSAIATSSAARGMGADAAHEMGLRLALFSIIAFLAIGMLVLFTVNEQHAKAAAVADLPEPALSAAK